jgi:adenylosuccinate synthase
VGNGPLPTEAESPFEERLRELGGEFGAVTGRPRRCGWFDATVVRYAARVNGLTGLAVTKLDVLDSFSEIPVCTGYRLEGERCDEMPAEVDALGRVQPVYERLPGWGRPTGAARTLADLPREARSYLDRLQELSGVPARYVSVGTRRDQIIEVA